MIDTRPQITSIQAEIVQHNRTVLVGPTASSVCNSCKSAGGLRRKDMRQRQVRFWEVCSTTGLIMVISQLVTLVRWRCKACGFTATQYPHFRPSV